MFLPLKIQKRIKIYKYKVKSKLPEGSIVTIKQILAFNTLILATGISDAL